MDFTKEIILDEKSQKKYRRLRFGLYLMAILAAIYFAYLIFFPVQFYDYSFANPNLNKGNVINPRDEAGKLLNKGNVEAGKKFYFDSSVIGNFSTVKISVDVSSKSKDFQPFLIRARKSYRSFLYPEGDPVGFRDGSLVKNNNNYFIISQGKLCQFQSLDNLNILGFSPGSFTEVSGEELKYNNIGDEIKDSNNYPDASIFKIDDAYYILSGQKLNRFISQKAFLTQYDENQAIQKDKSFLNRYQLAENLVGFAGGSLINYGDGIYIVSGASIYPINNPETFVNMGYDWNDVIKVNGDELSIYKKENIFNINTPHPDGTIFLADENSKWFIIKNGEKDSLPSENIARSWFKKNPIRVSAISEKYFEKCELSKAGFIFSTYECRIPVDKFKNFEGRYYEFSSTAQANIKLDKVSVEFKRFLTVANLKSSIKDMINKILIHYGFIKVQIQ